MSHSFNWRSLCDLTWFLAPIGGVTLIVLPGLTGGGMVAGNSFMKTLPAPDCDRKRMELGPKLASQSVKVSIETSDKI